MSARTDLEAAQAELKTLKAALAAWPAQSAERLELAQHAATLAREIVDLEASQVDDLARERRARTVLDDATGADIGPRGRWYRSMAAPVAVVAALIVALRLAIVSLDHLNWTFWAQRSRSGCSPCRC